MKKLLLILSFALLLCLAACVTSNVKAVKLTVTPEEIASTPDKFPVVKEMPDSKFFGNYEGGNYAYWIGMKDDKLAIHFNYKGRQGTSKKWVGDDWTVTAKGFKSQKGSNIEFKGDGETASFDFKGKSYTTLKRISG